MTYRKVVRRLYVFRGLPHEDVHGYKVYKVNEIRAVDRLDSDPCLAGLGAQLVLN